MNARILMCLCLSTLACSPEVTVQQYTVLRSETLRCVSRGDVEEDCSAVSEQEHTLPVILESELDQVTLYIADPETGDDRVFVGGPQPDALYFRRQWRRQDEAVDCSYQRTEDVIVTKHDTLFEATERALNEESAGCNALNLRIFTRVEWSWRGE